MALARKFLRPWRFYSDKCDVHPDTLSCSYTLSSRNIHFESVRQRNAHNGPSLEKILLSSSLKSNTNASPPRPDALLEYVTVIANKNTKPHWKKHLDSLSFLLESSVLRLLLTVQPAGPVELLRGVYPENASHEDSTSDRYLIKVAVMCQERSSHHRPAG